MSMCRVLSCIVGRGCLLWPVPSLGKTLLAFALLHFVLQGQTCLLLQVSQLGVFFVLFCFVLFCFGSASSFWRYFSIACWAPTNLASSSFSVISFCLFILFMGFSREERWSGLPFPSPVDYVLSELSTMTRPSWVALQGMAYRFIELDKAVIQVISVVSFL